MYGKICKKRLNRKTGSLLRHGNRIHEPPWFYRLRGRGIVRYEETQYNTRSYGTLSQSQDQPSPRLKITFNGQSSLNMLLIPRLG